MFLQSCAERDVRGWRQTSDDGKAYLVVDDPDGGNCPPIYLDRRELDVNVGVKIEVSPGDHVINCGTNANPIVGIGFRVPEGTTFHFDYWGP